MVLVETSVWIKSLAGVNPWMKELDSLLSLDQVSGHELVDGELLIGGRGGRVQGCGAGWIDIQLLASAIVQRLQLWTTDPRLATTAQEFGVAYIGPN